MEERFRRDRGLDCEAGELPDPLERVDDLARLGVELCLVSKVLEAAAAALGKVLAGSVDARRSRLDDLHRHGLGMTPFHLRHASADLVAREAAPYEDDEPVQPRDSVAAVGERVDRELELLVFPKRCGHVPTAG